MARPTQLEVEAGDAAAVRTVEARRREALGERPPHDNVHTLLLKYRSVPAARMQLGLAAACAPAGTLYPAGPARRWQGSRMLVQVVSLHTACMRADFIGHAELENRLLQCGLGKLPDLHHCRLQC